MEKIKYLYSSCIFALLVMMYACGSHEPLTKRLFMQSDRANVALLNTATDSVAAAIVSESVSFGNRTDSAAEKMAQEQSKENIWRSVDLEEVSVVAEHLRIKRIPVYKGKITLTFYVKAPRNLLDSCWKLTLIPELIDRDTVISLAPVILPGWEFTRQQENQYEKYNAFLESIVPDNAYDSVFLDRKNIRRDIYNRQHSFWKLCEHERKLQMAYEAWRVLMEKRYFLANMKAQGNRLELKHRMQRATLNRSMELFVQQRDTVGIRDSYVKAYSRRVNFWPSYDMQREMSVAKVPGRYQHIYLSGRKLSDIRNYSLTSRDSVEIASHRYFFKDIVRNEHNEMNREQIREWMIDFPYADSARVNRIAKPSEDFSYVYRQTVTVKEGMKKLRVTLRGGVMAIDKSIWSLPAADTLTFVIASVSDLADTLLLHRLETQGDSLAVKTPAGLEYRQGLLALSNREYARAFSILSKYQDYNTALCLTCLGYHAEAEEILKQLPVTARTEYLWAIVSARLDKLQEAIEHLLNACRQDVAYTYRVEVDAELSELVARSFRLKDELERIKNKG